MAELVIGKDIPLLDNKRLSVEDLAAQFELHHSGDNPSNNWQYELQSTEVEEPAKPTFRRRSSLISETI